LYRNGTQVPNPHIATLSAGVYNYTCTSAETQNYTATSTSNMLTVNKGITSISLYLNGTDSDRTYHIYQTSNITAQINVSGKQICLYSNLTGFSTICNTTMITSLQHLKQVGTFYTTANFTGDENYTSSSTTHYITVINDAPNTTTPIISPSSPTLYDDLTCNATLTDTENSTLIAYYNWYKCKLHSRHKRSYINIV